MAGWVTTGPTTVPGSSGSPTDRAPRAATTLSATSAETSSWT